VIAKTGGQLMGYCSLSWKSGPLTFWNSAGVSGNGKLLVSANQTFRVTTWGRRAHFGDGGSNLPIL